MLLQGLIETYCRSDELVDIRFKCDEGTVSEYYGKANEIPETLLSETTVQQVRVITDQRIPRNGYGFVEFSLEILVQPVNNNSETDGKSTESEKLDSNENDSSKAEKTKSTNPKNCIPNKYDMKLDKDEFLKTELGIELKKATHALKCNDIMRTVHGMVDREKSARCSKAYDKLFDYLKSCVLLTKQLYGIDYIIVAVTGCYGLGNIDCSGWLYDANLSNPEDNNPSDEQESKSINSKPSTFKEAYKTYIDYFGKVLINGELESVYELYRQCWREFDSFKEFMKYMIDIERK